MVVHDGCYAGFPIAKEMAIELGRSCCARLREKLRPAKFYHCLQCALVIIGKIKRLSNGFLLLTIGALPSIFIERTRGKLTKW